MEVSPTSNPNTPCDDVDEDLYGEHFDVEALTKKGEMVFGTLPKGSKAIPPLCEIIAYAIKSREIIEGLKTQIDERYKLRERMLLKKHP